MAQGKAGKDISEIKKDSGQGRKKEKYTQKSHHHRPRSPSLSRPSHIHYTSTNQYRHESGPIPVISPASSHHVQKEKEKINDKRQRNQWHNSDPPDIQLASPTYRHHNQQS